LFAVLDVFPPRSYSRHRFPSLFSHFVNLYISSPAFRKSASHIPHIHPDTLFRTFEGIPFRGGITPPPFGGLLSAAAGAGARQPGVHGAGLRRRRPPLHPRARAVPRLHTPMLIVETWEFRLFLFSADVDVRLFVIPGTV